MRPFLHLLVHDARVHARLLAAWMAIAVAHPLVVWSSTWLSEDVTWALAFALVAGRVAGGLAVVATIVQADGPADDRAFWRTRPITSTTMAAAKATLIASVFLLGPAAIVVAVAMAIGIPAAFWPWSVVHVFVWDAPLLGAMAFVATRTRNVTTALVALVAVVMGFFVSMGVLTRVHWAFEDGAPVSIAFNPAYLEMVGATLLSLAAVTIAALQYPRRRTRVVASAIAAVCAVAGLAVVEVPMRGPLLASSAPPPLTVSVDEPPRLMANRDQRGGWGLVARVTFAGSGADGVVNVRTDGWTVTAADGRAVGGHRDWKPGTMRGRENEPAPKRLSATHPLELATLDRQAIEKVQGGPVRYEGTIAVTWRPTTAIAHATLAPGAMLSTPSGGLLVHTVSHSRTPNTQIATGSVRWLNRARGDFGRLRDPIYLREARTGTRVIVAQRRLQGARLAEVALLPSFARPFAWAPVALHVDAEELAGVTVASARLEVIPHETIEIRVPASFAFTMPDAP